MSQTPKQTARELADIVTSLSYKYLGVSNINDNQHMNELLEKIKFIKFIEALMPEISFELKE